MNKERWLQKMLSGEFNPILVELLKYLNKRTFKDRIKQFLPVEDKRTEFMLAVTEFGRMLIEELEEKENLTEFEYFAANAATLSLSITRNHRKEMINGIIEATRTRKIPEIFQKDKKYSDFWEKHKFK